MKRLGVRHEGDPPPVFLSGQIFPFEVQFGHAGALANSQAQTADAKNAYVRCVLNVPASSGLSIVHSSLTCIRVCCSGITSALREAGAIVPKNFNDFVACIRSEFERLVRRLLHLILHHLTFVYGSCCVEVLCEHSNTRCCLVTGVCR